MAEIADELRAKLRDEWLRKATSSFTCQECGIQANFIDEIINALDAKDKRIAELETHKRAQAEDIMKLGKGIGAMAVALAKCADILDTNDFGHDVRFQARELSDRYLPAPPSSPNKEDRNG